MTKMTAQASMTESTDFEDGDRVRVTYTGSYRGREHTFEATVVTDPYTHRDTPEDAVDLKAETESGTSYRRVDPDGRLRGLHHATKRHDTWMGEVMDLSLIEEAEVETEMTNEFADTHEATEAAHALHEDVDAVAGKPHVHTKRLDDAREAGLTEAGVSLRLTTRSRRLSAEAMAVLADHEADVEYLGKSETWSGHEWLLWIPVEVSR